LCPFVGADLERGGGDVLFEVLHLGRAGDGEHNGRALEEPGERELCGCGIVARGELGQSLQEGMVGLEQLASGHGIPGQECDASLLAPGEGLFVAAVGERVAILNADDGNDLLRLFDLGGRNFAEADVADFSLVLHLAERAEGFFEWGARIDAVKLVEFDALEFEATEAHFNAMNEVAGAANVLGFGGALASDAALGGDDEVGRIRMQGFADEAFGDFRAVGVGGVDKGDAERDGAAEDAAGFVWIAWFTPGTFANEAHGSVAEALDGEVAGNVEGSAGGSGGSAHDLYAKGKGNRD